MVLIEFYYGKNFLKKEVNLKNNAKYKLKNLNNLQTIKIPDNTLLIIKQNGNYKFVAGPITFRNTIKDSITEVKILHDNQIKLFLKKNKNVKKLRYLNQKFNHNISLLSRV